MKKKLLVTFALVYLLIVNVKAQYAWSKDTAFLGAPRAYDVGFSIGHYLYVGCGAGTSTYYNDFWRWNQDSNTWTAVASYPGLGYRICPTAFSIEGKGYVGLGQGASGMTNDLWSYDTSKNKWTQMATFPGTPRYAQSVFVVGHKAFIIGGSIGGPPYLDDVWMYDAHANSWTQMNNSPSGKMETQVTFTIGNHGYLGGGFNSSTDVSTFWEYDTTTDTWATIANIPIVNGIGGCPSAFVLGSKAYVCLGGVGTNSKYTTYGYRYDTITKAWSVFTNMEKIGISGGYGVGFSIGNIGYIATGRDSLGNPRNILWQYSDTSTTGISSNGDKIISLFLYPNPSLGVLHIKCNVLIDKQLEFRVTDVFGRIINTSRIDKQNLTLDEAKLGNGIYFYQVLDSDKLISSGKFIIQK